MAFGEVLLRLGARPGRRLADSGTLDVQVGGSEANVAVHLARWGWSTRLVTRLPDGPLGDAAAQALRGAPIDLTSTERTPGRMGLYFLEPGAGPRPARVIYDRAGSPFARLDADALDWPSILDGATHLHLSGITPALGTGPARAVGHALDAARERDIRTSFDLNHRPALWPAEDAGRAIGPLLDRVDLLIAPSAQLASVLGVATGDGSEPAIARQAREVCRRFGSERLAVTLRHGTSADRGGFRAALYDTEGDALAVSPRIEVPFIDRVGAGDAFAAGLLFALGRGDARDLALSFATAAGALAHTLAGDAPALTVREIESLAAGRDGRIRR